MRRIRVRLHGHDLHARDRRRPGPGALLVLGLLGSGAGFGPALTELARTHLVVAPDLLGPGASEEPAGDYSPGSFATQARDLLTVLGVDAATAVGHSLGGGIALPCAHQFPDLRERLVLVDPGARAATSPPPCGR